MIALLENGLLTTDLDGNNFAFENVASLDPVPSNLVGSDDTRLTDAREPLPGSVTDASVANDAAIQQSKLSLDGDIPAAWVGTSSTTAARGDLAEYLANKNQPNGYCGLDSGGKIPNAAIPTEVGTGTITEIGLSMPVEFLVAGSPINTAGTFAVTWADAPDQSWFGNHSGFAAPPIFNVDPLPASLIPGLDAAKIVSGELDPLRLPEAVAMGVGHASGAVPDPGDGTGGALATDYLARDMSYQPAPVLSLPYQPDVVDPTLTPSSNITGARTVVFGCATPGAQMFYSLTSALTGFQEIPAIGYISLAPSAEVWCYAAQVGYNNSNIVNYTNPNP